MEWKNSAAYSTLRSIVSHYIARSFTGLTQQEVEFMSDVATQDLINYLAVKYDFLYDPDYAYKSLVLASKLAEENPLEFDSTLSDWVEVWALKWRQRVKLVMSDDPENVKAVQRLEDKVSPILDSLSDEAMTLKKFAVGSLIRLGEVCFTNLMADMALKEVIYKVAINQSVDESVKFISSNPLFVVNELIRRVKEISQFKGNLVVVRVNPSFFQEARGEVVEW
ncbi:hypothetical protein IG193_07015 [Infirmifilum lucidum]|uniref:Uncharacterized protein n=1 Tax=Infirmifilum lucidum TaxID=2776706 RepID=A0A7L9FFJ2_9CREN|nr:hypothetical protein [Infirmifilum lucidum]QOJ78499.1 hypothetical protein IG193_07015 [Infirmifilum lucidum]